MGCELNGLKKFWKKPPDRGCARLYWYCCSPKNWAWAGVVNATSIAVITAHSATARTAAAISQRENRILLNMAIAQGLNATNLG
jgi:hypothetical protein